MATPTITSELDAINIMLSCIGEAPVSSIDKSISEVEMASNTLDQVLLEILARGRSFNREDGLVLYPDTNGYITAPQGTLWLDAAKYESNDYVLRGNRVYDRNLHTFKIGKSITCDVILALSFEELPFPARLYAAIKAARQFQADVQGSDSVFRFSEKAEQDALILFDSMEQEAEDANVLNQNYHAQTILRRYGPAVF